MSAPLQIRFQLSPLEMYALSLRLLGRSVFRVAFSLLFPIAGLGLLALAWSARKGVPEASDWLVVLLCVTFPFVLPLITTVVFRRGNRELLGEVVYEFAESGFSVAGAGQRVEVSWSAIKEIVRSGSFLLLFVSKAMAYAVPWRAVERAGVRPELEQLVSVVLTSRS